MQSVALDIAATTRAAIEALQRGEAARARDLLDQVIAANGADASTWLAMAHARASLGDAAGKLGALDAALALEPTELRALIAKADHLTAQGDARGASAHYAAALQHLPRYQNLPPHLQEALRRAQAAQARLTRDLEDFVRGDLTAKGFAGADAPRRFTTAVDVLFGKKRAYVQEPRYLFYPELPQIQFYERAAFAWMDAIEAATDDIRTELQSVVAGEFKPYVTQTPGRPANAQLGMADSPSWTAYFLWKDGAERDGAARCPKTMAALAHAPLTRIKARAPSVLFSKLTPGAHIPPHNGMLNARLICHLPLIVPKGCDFRVGNDVRAWEEGRAWAFDDTIEHEAWNRGGADRYVLIFDVWRPELSEEERAGVAALCEAVDAFGGAQPWDA